MGTGNEVTQPRESMHDFYERMCPKLIARASKMCKNQQDAEDAVHDAFAAVLPRWAQYGEYETPEAVVQRAMVQRVRKMQWRRARWLGLVRDAPMPDPSSDPQLSAEAGEVIAALRNLPPRQRTVLVLYAWNGCSTQEIADLLGISDSTVRVHMHKARTSLNLWFGLEGWEADPTGLLPETGLDILSPDVDGDGDETVMAAVRRAGEELERHFEADRTAQERILAALKDTAARQGWSVEGKK
ncbi:sigma-70 family RNA polymerase sigma factor [Streptomyces sp. NPDC048295]|uniref:RNA polymerase sigma factor n=1 Tax=Streptomyces sp. NPDC048295 TaxID=3154617 RepID=UPI0034362956